MNERQLEKSIEMPLPDTDAVKAEGILKMPEIDEKAEIEGAVLIKMLERGGVRNVGTIDVSYGRTPDDIIFYRSDDGTIKPRKFYPATVFTGKEIKNVVAFGTTQGSGYQVSGAKKMEDVISELQG